MDEEESKIEERISQIKAEEYLEVWKRLNIKEERAHAGHSERHEPLLRDSKLKDKLFVETGEDVEDIFNAFKHYRLNHEITDDDRKRY